MNRIFSNLLEAARFQDIVLCTAGLDSNERKKKDIINYSVDLQCC